MKVFIEKQKFNQPFIFIVLALALVAACVVTFNKWKVTTPSTLLNIIGSLSGLIIIIAVIILFTFIKLKTKIDEIGIHYQFYPLHFNFKTIRWSQISKCFVRNYSAISEYGGWGIKKSLFKRTGKSYTVKGNIGLQLVLKNGEKLLIGSQLKDKLEKTIKVYESKII